MALLSLNPFEWVSQHLAVIGWPTVCLLAWKVSRFVTNLENRAVVAEAHITKMATNEMPHMQAALEEIQKSNASIDSSLKTLVSRTPEK